MPRFGHNPHSSMRHLNGNLLCAIDVETTGLDPMKHDIIQLAVLPLDAEIKPLQTVMPFYVNMKPKRPENIEKAAMKVNKTELAQLIINGLDPWKCVDMFEEWFERLNLPVGKKIVPLAHNWIFDSGFIREWMGPLSFAHFIDYHYRDSMTAALYLNDRADAHVEPYPFPKVSLGYCCSQLKIDNINAHDALADCVATAEVYRRMLMVQTL